ncbi:MAG: hypothetical protein N2C14_07120, partial [Planctomycetales bacterium]
TVSTIFCGPAQQGINTQWRDGALLADGSFMAIDQNRAEPVIASPQDKELAKLSGKINTTYLPYGSAKKQQEVVRRQDAQDANASKSNVAAAASRAQFKGSYAYDNSRWDLVDALRKGKLKLKDLKEEELPQCLRELKPEQRQAHIEEKSAERYQIQEQIKKLSSDRNKYIAQQRTESKDQGAGTLDQAILKAARSQAEKKNFRFTAP